MTLCIIFICLFVISLILLLVYEFTDWYDVKAFIAIIILFLVSGVGMIASAVPLCQEKAKEYPASEYDFKIKVVEFEEHRDTILVVTPKEE